MNQRSKLERRRPKAKSISVVQTQSYLHESRARKCFLQNDKTWFGDREQISFPSCRRLKELKLADVDVSFMFLSLSFNQHLFSFAKNFHMKHNKDSLMVFFDVAKVPQHTRRNTRTNTSLQSFLGNVWLEFLDRFLKRCNWIPRLCNTQAWLCFKMVASSFAERKETLYSARNSSYFVCSSLSSYFQKELRCLQEPT